MVIVGSANVRSDVCQDIQRKKPTPSIGPALEDPEAVVR
jgi:hypothetical protein